MHIAVFCGSSMPRNKEIVEAADGLVAVNSVENIFELLAPGRAEIS